MPSLLRSLQASLGASLVVGAVLASCARTEVKPAPAEPSAGADEAGVGEGGGGMPRPSGTATEPGGACGFASTPTSFALPTIQGLALGGLSNALATEAKCFDGKPFRYMFRDMDGDLKFDLVVQTDCTDTTIGLDAWNVYTNIGTGFASTPKRFALPQPRLDFTCAKTALEDVNGDLKPDFIVTTLCTDPTVGTSRWMVYPNGPDGFGVVAPYALPPGAAAGAFPSLFENADCTSGRSGFTFFDLDGDRKDDLVVTSACDNTQVGTTSWRVYLGSGTGVAATPIAFPLPTTPSVPLGTYSTTAGPSGPGCDGTTKGPRYSVDDVDHDFKPDLLVTQDCTDATVGTTHWSVYRNSGTGFAPTPAPFALPVLPGVAPNAFPAPSGPGMCVGPQQTPHFIFTDLDGNSRGDLVMEQACGDDTTGVSRWLLFRDVDGGGFAPTASSYALPAALGGTVSARLGLSGPAACNTSPLRQGYTVLGLGELERDLIVTSVCDDATVGTSRWLVYKGACP
ncbi:MAG: hypothetical protein QOI41_2046 [Myxococcales bacterium]|jgi:hypothetical protein|nr:hypothetical protein [Myxococcales bacterium]